MAKHVTKGAASQVWAQTSKREAFAVKQGMGAQCMLTVTTFLSFP